MKSSHLALKPHHVKKKIKKIKKKDLGRTGGIKGGGGGCESLDLVFDSSQSNCSLSLLIHQSQHMYTSYISYS